MTSRFERPGAHTHNSNLMPSIRSNHITHASVHYSTQGAFQSFDLVFPTLSRAGASFPRPDLPRSPQALSVRRRYQHNQR